MYPAVEIANYFVERRATIDPLRLQKLVYISYGLVWKELREELYPDRIEAWKLGPVIPTVYYAFRYQDISIQKPVKAGKRLQQVEEEDLELSHGIIPDIEKILREHVYKKYASMDPITISQLTHEDGTPWAQVFNGKRNVEIPKELIQEYYEKVYDR